MSLTNNILPCVGSNKSHVTRRTAHYRFVGRFDVHTSRVFQLAYDMASFALIVDGA